MFILGETWSVLVPSLFTGLLCSLGSCTFAETYSVEVICRLWVFVADFGLLAETPVIMQNSPSLTSSEMARSWKNMPVIKQISPALPSSDMTKSCLATLVYASQ